MIEDAITALPCWQGGITLAPLLGGITNRNFVVTDQAGRFVVRLGSDIPLHGVMQFNELAAARAAHAAGISPEVVYAIRGAMVSRFVEGRALLPEDFRAPATRAAALEIVRRCHTDVARHLRGASLIFWVFQVNRSYLGTLDDAGSRLHGRLADLAALNARLEAAVGKVNIVFGHNDLLAANWLDDGKRLWLIDWDYAGFNSPLFDLANLSSNNGFSAAEDEALLAGYFGQPPDDGLRRSFKAMACASLLREALWSAVSEIFSTVDFDYAAYTEDYFARLEIALLAADLA